MFAADLRRQWDGFLFGVDARAFFRRLRTPFYLYCIFEIGRADWGFYLTMAP
jgi:hypothetical protein